MGKSIEKLAVVALLPEIAPGEELSNVNPGLVLSDGTAVEARMSQATDQLIITPNGNGTVNIRNVSLSEVPAGQRILISASQRNDLPGFPVDLDLSTLTPSALGEDVIPDGAWTYSLMRNSDTIEPANTDVPLPFENPTSSSPLGSSAANAVLIESANPGRVRFLKTGNYRVLIDIALRMRGGGAANVAIRRAVAGLIGAEPLQVQTVNFTNNESTFFHFSLNPFVPISQGLLNAGGGQVDYEFSINTNVAGATFSFGPGTGSVIQAGNIHVIRVGNR